MLSVRAADLHPLFSNTTGSPYFGSKFPLLKKASFFEFTRPERWGAVGLVAILAILLGIRLSLGYFTEPLPLHPAGEDSLNRAYALFVKEHGVAEEERGKKWGNEAPVPIELGPFDPNTVDYDGLRRLGVSPKAARGWINWRDNFGKRFYTAAELKAVRNLTEEDYNRIAPYIRISISPPAKGNGKWADYGSKFPKYEVPAFVDINTADTQLLDRAVAGIGAVLARKIIERRNALGGYYNLAQVVEGLRLPDSTRAALEQKLRFDGGKVRKLNLNTATLEQLKAHPYIGERTAPNILQMRNALGKFSTVEELRQVPLMTGEIYRKIAPYCTVD